MFLILQCNNPLIKWRHFFWKFSKRFFRMFLKTEVWTEPCIKNRSSNQIVGLVNRYNPIKYSVMSDDPLVSTWRSPARIKQNSRRSTNWDRMQSQKSCQIEKTGGKSFRGQRCSKKMTQTPYPKPLLSCFLSWAACPPCLEHTLPSTKSSPVSQLYLTIFS